MNALSAAAVEQAAARLGDVVARTPVQHNERLSAGVDGDVWLKREDLHSVRSYKLRGAYNVLAQLGQDQRPAGVVAASAGNHAQGLAFACRALGMAGRVYVPHTTPRQKRERIPRDRRRLPAAPRGGRHLRRRRSGRARGRRAHRRNARPSVRRRAHHRRPGNGAARGGPAAAARADVVVVPVGGGGLLAGALLWLRARHPSVRVVGVEPAGAASMQAALSAGRPVDLEVLDSFVDGAAVRRAGDVTYPVVRDLAAELVTVLEGRVRTEMLDLYAADGIIAEPAGALATASLGGPVAPPPGALTGCVLSGGNHDVSRYADVVERSLVHEGYKHFFLVEFPQEPGALRRFLDEVLGPDDDITLFEYVKRNNREAGPALVGIELGRRADLAPLLARMEAAPPSITPVPPDSPLFRFVVWTGELHARNAAGPARCGVVACSAPTRCRHVARWQSRGGGGAADGRRATSVPVAR